MFFLNKKRQKPVIVDCYTFDKQVYEYAKISKASKFFPEWWKSLPADDDNPNMRHCYGFVSQHEKSFVLPLWSDLDIDLEHQGYRWSFKDCRTSAEVHGGSQFAGWIDPGANAHLKLSTPWMFRCSEEIHFQWSDASWSKHDLFGYHTPPAIVEYKYQSSVGVNLIFNTTVKPRSFRLKHGQPLVYITPLTERPVEFRFHLVTEDEYKSVAPVFPSQKKKSYLTYKRIQKEKEKEQSSCPFSSFFKS